MILLLINFLLFPKMENENGLLGPAGLIIYFLTCTHSKEKTSNRFKFAPNIY